MEKGPAKANERQRKEQFEYLAMHAPLRDGAGIAKKRRAGVAVSRDASVARGRIAKHTIPRNRLFPRNIQIENPNHGTQHQFIQELLVFVFVYGDHDGWRREGERCQR